MLSELDRIDVLYVAVPVTDVSNIFAFIHVTHNLIYYLLLQSVKKFFYSSLPFPSVDFVASCVEGLVLDVLNL